MNRVLSRGWWGLLCAAAALPAMSAPPMQREAALSGVWALASPVGQSLHDENGAAPPLTSAAQALYEQRRAQLGRGDDSFDPSSRCKPIGFPRSLWDGGPFDIQVQADVVLFGYTWNRNHRIVYFGETLPALQIPRYYGTSVAHWQGDTLQIDSALFTASTLLDSAGLPHGEQMRLTERYRVRDQGRHLQVQLTLTDAQFYTRAWHIALRFNKLPNARIQEDVCEERSEYFKRSLGK